MEPKKKALGKGLEQLFSNNAINFEDLEKEIIKNESDSTEEVFLSEIRKNPYQPRKTFSDESINELAESIKEFGVIQPIILKRSIKGYELIAGERRCRAAEKAGLEKIPAIIKEFTDEEMMEVALLENIQREDLNPIEVAESINAIINMKNITQEEFAKKMGKSRTYVTNMLGLLRLPIKVKDMLRFNAISMSHARSLSKLDLDDEAIIDYAEKINKEKLSVHDLDYLLTNKRRKKEDAPLKKDFTMYENILSEKIERSVKITNSKVEIKIKGEEDLMDLFKTLDIEVDDI